MRTGQKWLKRVGIAGFMLAGLALAQAATVNTETPNAATTTITPSDAVAQSKAMFDKMKTVAKRVQVLLAEAIHKKDVVRIDCLRDKDRQLNGFAAVAKNIQETLATAPDDDTRVQQFRRMSIVHEKATTVGTEAEACVGEDVSYVGVTQTSVDIDPSIPTTDPTQQPLPPIDIGRPPEATPFV